MRRTVPLAATAALALVLTACSGGTASGSASGR